MNKKGFTLMELLLVVAVLAIVSAAAAPTFFGGAQETMEEALKAKMFAAYKNCVSGSNLLLSIAASHGVSPVYLPPSEWRKEKVLTWIDEKGTPHELAEYAPLASRVFENKKGKKYTIRSTFNGQAQKCVIIFAEGANDYGGSDGTGMITQAGLKAKEGGETKRCLDIIWEQIKDKEP